MRSERVSPRAFTAAVNGRRHARCECQNSRTISKLLAQNGTAPRMIAALHAYARQHKNDAYARQHKNDAYARLNKNDAQLPLRRKFFCLLGPKPCKNCESRMSEANPRQSLVKGERLIRYELASAITRLRRSCAKRTFTWGQRSGRKSAANGWTWSKTT